MLVERYEETHYPIPPAEAVVDAQFRTNLPVVFFIAQTTLAFYVQSVEDSQRHAIAKLEEQMFPSVPKFGTGSELIH